MPRTTCDPRDGLVHDVAQFMRLHATPADWLGFLKAPLLIAKLKNDSGMLGRLLLVCDQLCQSNDQNVPFSPLHHAAEQGDRDVVELLVTLDERLVHSQDKEGWVALHHSARRGDVPTIQSLLAHGSSCLAATNSGFIPVFLAVRGGHVGAVDCLLSAFPRGRRQKHVADVYRMPSISLTVVTHPDMLRTLQKYVDKNRREYKLWIRDVAAGGKAGAVSVLVEGGVDVEAPGFFPDGWSILHIAVQNCNAEACGALLKHGANKDSKDDKGRTPLHRAVLCTAVRGWERAAAMAEFLLKWGPDVTTRDCDGHTAADLVKAADAPNRTKAPFAAMLAKARAGQCSSPTLRAMRYKTRLARERGYGPGDRFGVVLPNVSPENERYVWRF